MGDIVLVLRPERVEHPLAFAGGVDAPFDAELADRLDKAETAAHHADRPDNGVGLGIDFVAGASQPVAARGRDVLDEDQHRDVLLIGEVADPPVDQRGLDRRTARRIDREGDRLQPLHRKCALDQAGQALGAQAAAQRAEAADHAVQPQDRYRRFTSSEPEQFRPSTLLAARLRLASPEMARINVAPLYLWKGPRKAMWRTFLRNRGCRSRAGRPPPPG